MGGGGLVTSRGAKVFRDGLTDHVMPALHAGYIQEIPSLPFSQPFVGFEYRFPLRIPGDTPPACSSI